MRALDTFPEIFIYQEAVDMRKQINGLAVIVDKKLGISPFTKTLFIFVNKTGKLIKLLYWDKTGFALWTKRLEKNRYKLPRFTGKTTPISVNDLCRLLEGYDIFRGHKELYYTDVA